MKKVLIIVLWIGLFIAGVVLGIYYSQEKNYHNAFTAQKDLFNKAFFKVADTEAESEQIFSIIVNHHLFAPDLIAKALQTASEQDPSVVVLISPNHFGIGKGSVITSAYDWQTPYGKLKANEKIIKQLQSQSDLKIEEEIFEKEHGIFNIVPFIKKVFPKTTIVPLIINERTKSAKINEFTEILNQTLPEDALIVGSFDFSHQVKVEEAEANDAQSLVILENLDYNEVDKVAVDSKTGLRMLLYYSQLRGADYFQLLDNTSSAKLIGDYSISDNTSYINGYFK